MGKSPAVSEIPIDLLSHYRRYRAQIFKQQQWLVSSALLVFLLHSMSAMQANNLLQKIQPLIETCNVHFYPYK